MKNRIRILATSDVHGFIYPYNYSDSKSADIGFGRLYTLIQALRDDNTLLIDNGDTLEGSPLTYYHYHTEPDETCPVTTVMNEMGYDYINLGNHDFNYGEKALVHHIVSLKAPCITSNVSFAGKKLGPDYVIREIEGKKIAIIGVTTQYIPHFEDPANIVDMKFYDAEKTLAKTVKLVKDLEKPDYIIGVYHGGFERDFKTGYPTEDLTGENEGYSICKNIPDLDVLIAGHQHHALTGKLFNTVYTETAANGADLACIDIYTDTNVIEAHLYDADTDADEAVLKSVQQEEDACQKWLDTPLGTSKIDLKITDEFDARLHKSQLITFLNKVEFDATGADLASNALFLGAKGFNTEITMRDIVSTYVYPNTLTVKKITGKVLREYLEKDAEFWSIADEHIIVSPWMDFPTPKQYNYDMVDGIDYTITVSNPVGERITSLTYKGEPVTDDMEFTIAMNNYRAAGGGDFAMLRNAPTVKEISSSMVELLADWLLKNKVIDFEPVNNITVVK